MPRNSVEQDGDALVGSQPTGIPDDDRSAVDRRAAGGVRGEDRGIQPERDDLRAPRETAPHEHLAGRPVADAHPGRAAQRPPLHHAEGQGEPLVEVLRAVEDIGRMPCAHRPHEQHLRGGERERLLVQVDDVPWVPERPPEGPWVIEEQGGVSADRGDPLDRFAGARDQTDRHTGLVPHASGEGPDVVAAAAQPSLALAPGVDNGAVAHPQNPHRCPPTTSRRSA